MSKPCLAVKQFELTVSDRLPRVDDRLGSVYQCVDQHDHRCLLHVMRIRRDSPPAARMYSNECAIGQVLPRYSLHP